MKSLDFMIIGAQKAGTTALSQFLSAHPELEIAKGKEVHLFSHCSEALNWSQERANQYYQPYFCNADPDLLWGEATPIYLYWSPIIPALKRYNPRLKLIVLLRDPVVRAISHYQMELSRKNEWLPLWIAFLLEPLRLWWAGMGLTKARRCHSYTSRGRYYQQLIWVRAHFSDEQILVLENNELRHDHQATLNRVCSFLGVSQLDVPAKTVFEGEYPRHDNLIMRCLIKPLLKWYFRKSNLQLLALLQEMNIAADWPWIKSE